MWQQRSLLVPPPAQIHPFLVISTMPTAGSLNGSHCCLPAGSSSTAAAQALEPSLPMLDVPYSILRHQHGQYAHTVHAEGSGLSPETPSYSSVCLSAKNKCFLLEGVCVCVVSSQPV